MIADAHDRLRGLIVPGRVITSPISTYSRSRVAPLTLPDVTELLALIGALEGLAAGHAAGLAARQRRELATELKRINRDLRASSRGTPVNFHDLYVTRGAGPRVRMLYDAIKPQVDRYVLM